VQAGLQLEALMLVRPITEARIWARDAVKAQVTAAALREKLGIVVRAQSDAANAVAGADIIVTTTPATEPLIKAGFVSAGQHITAMGSDAEHKNEIAPAILRMADLYVADSARQTRRLGELHHAIAAGVMAGDADVTELGQIIAGAKHGRRSASDITIADLTGTGVQDTAIATLARDRARAVKAGTIFES
jgi:ornithine cyclodeaminase